MSAPSHVFTPEWIAQQTRRYGNSPAHARPTLYNLWTSQESAADRAVIEEWVEQVPPERRPRVISNLRSPDQFTQTYNELAVGDSLRRAEWVVEYEPEIEGLRPDWLARPRGRAPGFILEVLSSMPPAERRRHDEGWDVLRRRLEAIPSSALLYIQPPFYDGSDEPILPPAGPRQKEIARNVTQWLKTNPPDGEGYEIDGITIRFLGRNPRENSVDCGVGCLPFWVESDPLRDAIKEKAGKYRELSQSLGLPFVVCALPDFGSGRGLRELVDAVLGVERCRLVENREGRPCEEVYRANEGLFARYPTLSAVTLGDLQKHRVTHTVLHNPSATFPLGEDDIPSGGPTAGGT